MIGTFAFGPDGWGDELLAGAWLTLRLALTTLPIGLALGLAVALARDSGSRLPRMVGEAYATVFRGLPELLTIFIVYHGLPRLMTRVVALVEAAFGWEPSGYQGEIGGFAAGVTALALVVGAFSSEVFLGAMRSLPVGQMEAAAALGLSRLQSLRLVVLPQALRLALPGLGNNWMTLLKDTSLVSIIALPDLMRQANVAAIGSREHVAIYLAACLIYLALSWASERALRVAGASATR